MKKLFQWLAMAIVCALLYAGVAIVVVAMQTPEPGVIGPQKMCPFLGEIQIACSN